MVVHVGCVVKVMLVHDLMHEGSSCVVLALCVVVCRCLLGWVIVNGDGGMVVRP